MDVRSQIAMVFHLDKCIGCHTCSISCKNIWTDRKGVEYAWFNNVETKPGTGYPHKWEDQEKYKGGWIKKGDKILLKVNGKFSSLGKNIFGNPHLPTMDDYYEPWTYDYEHLFTAPLSSDQPTAKPISRVTGKYIDIKSGPSWDDDLSGSEIYARNDINLEGLSQEEKDQLNELERLVFFYLPRICNHCVNPTCLAACPQGAIYKRGEDGIVLINQDNCKGWRMCISGCPYKKVYYNWSTGKSEKCLLCYPRLETGQAPACFHSCVGRIRYLGVLLYDAEKITEIAALDDSELVDGIRNELILDPFDPEVIKKAKENGIDEKMLEAAQNSPIYKFVKLWQIALPLHSEYRTLPMLFYVPPLLPIIGKQRNGIYDQQGDLNDTKPQMSDIDRARIPIKYMASLFSAGNEEIIYETYKKLMAVRIFKRAQELNDISPEDVATALEEGKTSAFEAEAIFQLTSLPTMEERFVIPPLARETQIEGFTDPFAKKMEGGFGKKSVPERRW